MEQIQIKGNQIRSRVSAMPHVEDVSGRGLMIGLELAQGISAREVLDHALQKGLLILTAADKVRLLPPLTISEEEMNRGLDLLEQVLKEF